MIFYSSIIGIPAWNNLKMNIGYYNEEYNI